MRGNKKPNIRIINQVYITAKEAYRPYVKCGKCEMTAWLDSAAMQGWLALGAVIQSWYCPRCHRNKKLRVDQCGLIWVKGGEGIESRLSCPPDTNRGVTGL